MVFSALSAVLAVFFSDSTAVVGVELTFFDTEVIWAWKGLGGIGVCSFGSLSGSVGIKGGVGAFLFGFASGGRASRRGDSFQYCASNSGDGWVGSVAGLVRG